MICLRLFLEFFKIGLFSVGGGLATIPFLQALGARTGWFSAADLADMIAVAESTPGAMGVNMSVYVGYACGGVPGSAASVLGLICPSVILVLLIAGVLKHFQENRVVNGVFFGLRPASAALVTSAGLSVAMAALFRQAGEAGGYAPCWPAILIAAAVFACLRLPKLKNLHPVVYIGLAAVIGAVFQL